MALNKVGENHLLLVVGGYDKHVHVYLIPRIKHQNNTDNKLFKYKFSLLGHLDSIKDLSFSKVMENNVCYLASCS